VPLFICITCSEENYTKSSDDKVNTEYETEAELQVHKLSAHGQAASWHCQYCQQCYKNNYNLRRHMNSSCKDIKNLNSEASFVNKRKLESSVLKLVDYEDSSGNESDSCMLNMCTTCGKNFSRLDGLKRHNKKPCCRKSEKNFNCIKCKVTFTRDDNLKRHMLKCKGKRNKDSGIKDKKIVACNKKYNEGANTSNNLKTGGGKVIHSDVKLVETSFKGRLQTYEILNNGNTYSPHYFFEAKRQRLIQLIRSCVIANGNVKVNFHF
jgi:hypothetical protein